MKRFISNTLLFILPIVLVMLALEVYLGNFNSGFQLKARYLNAHADAIEILVLGSSHDQNAINPAVFKDSNAVSLAYGGQDFRLDYYLLKKALPKLPNLKFVALELGYHSLDIMHGGDYEKNNLYLRTYGINNFERRSRLLDYSIFFSNQRLYLQLLNPFVKKTPINEYGFETQMSAIDPNVQRFAKMNYDSVRINKDRNNSFITRHQAQNSQNTKDNKIIFEKMVRLCLAKKVRPVILIPPVYANYYAEMIPSKKTKRDDFLQQLLKRYPKIILIDCENDPQFHVKDFYNEDHLNPTGAAKFSKLVDFRLRNHK